MSDSPVLPQSFSFEARDAIFNMTLIETLGFGVYTAIFWFTMYTLVLHERAGHAPRRRSTYLTIIPLYILALIHLSTRWFVARRAFVVHGDTADSILEAFLTQPHWCNGLSVISFSLMILIADYVTVWRCWVVWGRSWKAALGPFLLVLAGTAFWITGAAFEIDPNSGLSSPHYMKSTKFIMISFILSLCSTTVCTASIVYRIISVSKMTGTGLTDPYRKVLEVIVESALLYCIVLIIYLPFLFKVDFSDAYPQALVVETTGLAPTIIVARVSLGISRDYTGASVDGPKFVAADAAIGKPISRIVFNEESPNELGSLWRNEDQDIVQV